MAAEITGSSTIRYVDAISRKPLELRVDQRVNAEILNVSGDQVQLVIRGTRVVGKLDTQSQASALNGQQQAQFIVKGMVDGVLQLQLVQPGVQQEQVGITSQWSILAQNLLQLNSLEINPANITIGRALLSIGLPITNELVGMMEQALNGLGNWGQPEADLAAVLMSNGLPLSTGTLSLALQQLPSLTEAYASLETRLSQWLQNSGVRGDIRQIAEKALNVLQGGIIDWSASSPELVKQMNQAVALWGKSLESQLADFIKGNNLFLENMDAANGLLAIATLRATLLQRGETRLVGEIDKFLDTIRQMQFSNASQTNDPTNPPWLIMELPLSANQRKATDMQMANLRIAYRTGEKGKSIDPENNRLVLSLNLDDTSSIEVDLSMVGKRVGAWLTVSSVEWRDLVEEELPSLKDGLEELGYSMQFARCEVKQAASVSEVSSTISKIDLEA